MRIVEDFPEAIRVIENLWIPMRDGIRLAARVWLPEGAEQTPVPAILEYMPYRKRDFTRLRDEPLHHYFAGHGYASIRLDLRGTGDSEGVVLDEYLAQEQDDAVDAIAWIREQPWCDGGVGMMGLSWGGFNALQVAARRPAGLRAILTLCSTDDRYADDAHYKGGCLLNENLTWGSSFFSLAAWPPDPAIAGADWRAIWQQRLDHLRLFPAVWMRHPHRDDYWRHGSVCEDYAAIECAVYAVGGWSDGYVNAIPRLMAGLTCPRKGLIGPWPHAFPHAAVPGPRIGMFQEAVRWWDHWLKDAETGIMDEPMLRVWLEEWVRPSPHLAYRPGRWVAEAQWPSRRIRPRRWHLNVGALGEAPDTPEDAVRVRSPQTTGLKGGEFYGYGAEGEGPLDQREDDGKSLVFDSDPLSQRLEILGSPEVNLAFTVDRPVAMAVVRLNDVAPDGTSARVTYGALNLCHREGHANPRPLQPGTRYRVRIPLNDIAYAFPAGHTVRISISTAYWPLIWPSPESVALTVHTGASTLTLPERPPDPADEALPPFAPPERGPGAEPTALEWVDPHRTVAQDLTTNETIYTTFGDAADLEGAALARLEEIDLAVGHTIRRSFRINESDPLSAQALIELDARLHRTGWDVRIECQTRMSATVEHFRVSAELEVFENGERIFHRHYDEWIPRQLL
ncbi:CocE/NonD family hydrolase [Halorhodospira halophila]|uniref:Peptidase S15 n=1 Tax=Halorhodospira halophila (strain DSM 244 / SL1) TaxID=349124 RepID=A1WX55_HALHL|nr:CocE/NonD family hydrolase [Halorhodospira halophila]ABM62267.1 peptidase S15 [Halorhodospira halophila SL1]MBK1729242.1 peptidase S15 [Halorhodospira halophila]